jgi:hypothetical protein
VLFRSPLEHLQGNIYELAHEVDGISFLQGVLLVPYKGLADLDNREGGGGGGGGNNNNGMPSLQYSSSAKQRVVSFIDLVVSELICPQYIVEMATSSFVSYFVQKLLERSNDSQLVKIVDVSSPFLHRISFTDYGTRFVQRLLERVATPNTNSSVVVNALCGGGDDLDPEVMAIIEKSDESLFLGLQLPVGTRSFTSLFFNEHSSHVIKKLLMFHPTSSQFIYPAVLNVFMVLWKKKPGCYVIQRVIEYGNNENKGKIFFFFFFFSMLY